MSANEFQLIEVTGDNPILFALEQRVVAASSHVLDTGSHSKFTQFLDAGGTPKIYIGYEKAGDAVGYLALSSKIESDTMEVRSIAVDPDFQYMGYGKRMMVYAESIAAQYFKREMQLFTSPYNMSALRFYHALGYSALQRLDNYYGDGTPRLLLHKSL